MSDITSLIYSLYQIGAIQFGEFTLKSREVSPIYINLRKIISYPPVLRQIAQAIWQTVSHCHFDLICGVPYAALPIATCLSLTHDIPMIMCRKEKKEHGTKQTIEGVYKTGQRCLIIEDVITTGGSIIETSNELRAVNLIIEDVAAFVAREEAGINRLSNLYGIHIATTLNDILQTLLSSPLITETEHILIKKFIEERLR